jgi:hypothetical protein
MGVHERDFRKPYLGVAFPSISWHSPFNENNFFYKIGGESGDCGKCFENKFWCKTIFLKKKFRIALVCNVVSIFVRVICAMFLLLLSLLHFFTWFLIYY